MSDIYKVANGIYGEVGSEDYETMRMVGSSMLNRLEAGRGNEFGVDIDDVLQKGYYAVKDNTPMYQQAVTQKFPDKLSENKYKQALQIASGLVKGTIERHPTQFFITPKEEKKASIDFNKLDNLGAVGKYNTYAYPKTGKKEVKQTKKSSLTFSQAFGKASKEGLKTFEWNGKKYAVKLK